MDPFGGGGTGPFSENYGSSTEDVSIFPKVTTVSVSICFIIIRAFLSTENVISQIGLMATRSSLSTSRERRLPCDRSGRFCDFLTCGVGYFILHILGSLIAPPLSGTTSSLALISQVSEV